MLQQYLVWSGDIHHCFLKPEGMIWCFILSSFDAVLSTHELFRLIFSPSCRGGRVSERLGGHLAVNQGQPTTHSTHVCSFCKWASADLLETMCSPGYEDSGQLGIGDGSHKMGAFVPPCPQGLHLATAWGHACSCMPPP